MFLIIFDNFSLLSYFSLDSGDIVFTQLARRRGLLAWFERENVTKQQTREGTRLRVNLMSAASLLRGGLTLC